MATFLAGADQTAAIAAGRAAGIADEKTVAAFLAFPTVVWDAGVAPTVPADMQWAIRNAFNRVGVNNERADLVYSKIATGVKAVATIPTVTGQQEALATQNLTAAGCRVGTKTYSTNAAPAGQVLTQSPVAGASEAGKPVNLTISLGP
jgi:hypothetical protein